MFSELPLIWGFHVQIQARPVRAWPVRARLASRGQRSTVEADGSTYHLAGTVVVGSAREPRLATAGDVIVLLAGELYNRDDLAQALGEPLIADGTDAQAVLACWPRYDVSTFRLVNGRFAAIVVDGSTIVAATDHAGTVPLYVRASQAGLEVATELKALTARHSLAGAALAGIPRPGASQVAAGTALVIRPTPGTGLATTAIRTWRPPDSRDILREDQAIEAVRDRLTRSVAARVATDPAPTVVLSGGIDSSGVAALAVICAGQARTVSVGTDAGDEFAAARLVAGHLGTHHSELAVGSDELLDELPWAVWAAEIDDPDVLEWVLPLVALYRRLDGPPRRILTGYGADIPLGGMHIGTRLLSGLDEAIARDMDTFDGLNEMSPVLSGVAGHWSTHPYWDREVVDLFARLEPGLKLRHQQDKWVLRMALADNLPAETLTRAKLGSHQGTGLTYTWTKALRAAGAVDAEVAGLKRALARRLFEQIVLGSADPSDVSLREVLRATAADPRG